MPRFLILRASQLSSCSHFSLRLFYSWCFLDYVVCYVGDELLVAFIQNVAWIGWFWIRSNLRPSPVVRSTAVGPASLGSWSASNSLWYDPGQGT